MKTVKDVYNGTPVWVGPDHTAESAAVLMRGHGLAALPVLQGAELTGMLSATDLLGIPPQARIGDLPAHGAPSLTTDMTVRDAADALADAGRDTAPVFEEGRLAGIIRVLDLLPEVRRSIDPLTRLPWSNALREWAIGQLKLGAEITVLFVDIDHFGDFNKKHGHIVGDEVLLAVTATLNRLTDPYTDFLCRYGGDEFCIATLRPAEEAEQLGEDLKNQVCDIDLPNMKEVVTCQVGRSGGKRTKEREHTHYMATLNNLINLASRDCMAQKAQRKAAAASGPPVAAQPVAPPRLRLSRVEVRRTPGSATALVDLELMPEVVVRNGRGGYPASHRFSASMTRDTDEEGLHGLVAETTAAALRLFLPDTVQVCISDILVSSTDAGQEVITTIGTFVTEHRRTSVAGSAIVVDEPSHAAARSVLAAVNRSLGLILEK
jgi:diguanylate cyclase (GGDEF)-like protein